jgi:hypothetical protein
LRIKVRRFWWVTLSEHKWVILGERRGSLRQYALVSQEQPWVEIHTRDEAGFWRISETRGLEADCEFTGIDCRVPMAALYEGVLEK